MIWLIPIGIACAVLFAICCAYCLDYWNSDAWAVGAVLSGIGLLVCIVIPIATYSLRAVGRGTCHRWGEQVGVKTKFVILNWADGGTCLAKTPGGHWVINSNWQAFVPAGK